MNSCFSHNYAIPFETFFQKKTGPILNPIELLIVDEIEIQGQRIHKALDFPGGPVLEIFQSEDIFSIQYAEYRARLLKNRIDICGPVSDTSRITQVLERVILAIHLQLHFPNLIPLHGGAIIFGERQYVFIGDSGAGKSTTVLELLKRGAKVLSDDLVFIDTHSMKVLPGLPTLRLLEKADVNAKNIVRVGPQIEKWWHLLEQEQLQDPMPIQHIFILKPGDALLRCQPAKGFSKASELFSQTFGFTHASESREQTRFQGIGKIAKHVPVSYLHFKKGQNGPIHIDELTSYLSST